MPDDDFEEIVSATLCNRNCVSHYKKKILFSLTYFIKLNERELVLSATPET